MPPASSFFPPFSATLFAGFLARPLPLAPLNLLLATAIQHMHRQHGDVFDRMRSVEKPTFLIVPSDLPFAFILNADALSPTLKAVRSPVRESVSATIRGPISVLISLMEGKIDGDALFFTRTLSFSGDTEAVLALRNAVDGTEITLGHDIKKFLGPFARLASPIGGFLYHAWQRSNADLALIAGALTGSQEKRLNAQESAIEALQQQIRILAKPRARKQT